MSFVKDLKFWKDCEKQFARYLIDYPWFVSLEMAQWKFKDYDIKLTTTDKVITYEIKSDTMADKTGNFVIECRYDGKASWIYASKADYIVYKVLDDWRIAERWELILRLINTEKRTTKWWDGWKSELYVIKCDELPNLFYPVNVWTYDKSSGDADGATGYGDS